jgi:uncharacterized protein
MRYNHLEKLYELKSKGAISEEEYQREKDKLLNQPQSGNSLAGEYWGMPKNTFIMVLHLAQFANYVLPFAGVVLPVIMWSSFKDHDADVDRHGRIVFNWLLSLFLYMAVCVPLVFIVIGIPLLLGLAICNIVFIILGAVNANDGKAWLYPLSIRFFAATSASV